MSSYGDEFDYAKQFVGNLRVQSKPVPVRVETRLRATTELKASDIEEYRSFVYDIPPRYVIEVNAPLQPGPQMSAIGRHYFVW